MKNLKIRSIKSLSIFALLACSGQAFGMMQRSVSQMLPPVAAALLVCSKRVLYGNQVNDPVWLKANHAVEQCRKKCGMPAVDSARLDEISTMIDVVIRHELADNIDHDLSDLMRPIVEPLVKKHCLDAGKVSAVVVKNPISHSWASVGGNTLIFSKQFLTWPHFLQIAAIEHELGHVLCQDSAYATMHKIFLSNSCINREHTLLCERRADTHSALQSLENTKALIHCNDGLVQGGYAANFKKYEMEQCFHDETLDKITKAKKLKYLLEKPTYLEELLDYMTKKENEKKLPPIIYL